MAQAAIYLSLFFGDTLYCTSSQAYHDIMTLSRPFVLLAFLAFVEQFSCFMLSPAIAVKYIQQVNAVTTRLSLSTN